MQVILALGGGTADEGSYNMAWGMEPSSPPTALTTPPLGYGAYNGVANLTNTIAIADTITQWPEQLLRRPPHPGQFFEGSTMAIRVGFWGCSVP
jgi:hypothetical protein